MIALVINAYFSVHFPISSRRTPIPPLNNVGKEDEHVAKHRLHNLRSNQHLLSFSSRNPTLYMRGGETFSRKDEGPVPTLSAGILGFC